MLNVKNIADCVTASREVINEAYQVTTREEHSRVWDKKVELLNIVNSALETGFWQGENYNMLWEAKHNCFKAERVAGESAQNTYMI